MRVLAHIHTYNEGDVIDRSLSALLSQQHPIETVLLVDNASTDNTLDREFPACVKVVRFQENRLTSDPIICAMNYALEHDYEWVWLLNGDSAPRPDSLARLQDLYLDFDTETRERVWLLAALPIDMKTGKRDDGFFVTPAGLRQVKPGADDAPYECDATIWSGSLYRMDAVRDVGLPRSDYAMDMAEIEYGYRGRLHGYRAFLHPGSIIDHNIGGPSMEVAPVRFGPFRLRLVELRPFRCYYVVRNVIHFWLYEFRSRNVLTYLYCASKVTKLFLGFLVRPFSHREQILACLRGMWDGLRGRLDYRYPP